MRQFMKADHFKLGTFSTNCSSGMTVTKVDERWDNSWDNNLRLAKMLDAAGVDFMLPIARWIGYGGETNFHNNVLETMTWATALLASTERLTVFATIHTAANHPVVVAKQIATADHVGKGRVGLNIVAGWNRPEYEALGLELPDDHETRYGYAQEWFDVVQKLWDQRRDLRLGRQVLPAQGDPRRSQAGRRAPADPERRRLGAGAGLCRCATPTTSSPRRSTSSGRRARLRRSRRRPKAKGRKVGVLTFSPHLLPSDREGGARIPPVVRAGQRGLGGDGQPHQPAVRATPSRSRTTCWR